ncbi:class I SAM-dependent methyltransferase [Pseudomonas vancouverensis]|uniref:class I SAM-dependent methyltransferase n=1 Tax=Pseudomonas vancouverensis TaxID=95300 RepID=UPI003D02A2CF
MSEVWSEGYFTDVDYIHSYSREINPVFMRYCLLLRGIASVESTEAYHCELGFGQGVSINIHAAANPGRFLGTDFTPSQAANATALAATYDSDSRFYDDSFEQLLARDDLPQFDSISLHGVWTWVSQDNQKYIVEFARRYLKPGGMLYISYNSLPGWSPAAPLRQLFSLHDRFVSSAARPTERIESALQFTEALLAANPTYAKGLPNLGSILQGIKGQDHRYLAHEYFNRDWDCKYFTDVVDALAPAKLEYVTTAFPLDAVDPLNLSGEAMDFLETIDHPIMREQARDYFVNRQFRRDLFMRGAIRLSASEQRQKLLNTRFVMLQTADSVSDTVSCPAGEAVLVAEVYAPVLHALAANAYAPKTLRQLLDEVHPLPYDDLAQAINVLVAMGAVAPCQSETDEALVQSRCSMLNLQLCKRSLLNSQIQTLASPVIGGGVTVGRFQQLFLIAIKQGKTRPVEWAQLAWGIIAEQGEGIVKDGKALTTAHENIVELTEQAETFAQTSLIILKALKVA